MKERMKKEDFLNKLRQNTHFQYDMPKEEIKGIEYEDTLKQFIEMTESVADMSSPTLLPVPTLMPWCAGHTVTPGYLPQTWRR